jgi:prepilin-type N-terminal cleavage/methylation domain-containing protein
MKPNLLQLIRSKQISNIQKHRGFTLIELLVVITIIGILASAAFPVINGVMARARKVKVMAVAKDLQVAIKSYQTEYNRYPGPSGADTTVDTRTDTNLVSILLGGAGTGAITNPREIKFLDLPIAKNGVGGLVGTGGAAGYTLVDEWGQGFTVIMDTDYDNQIDNPDTSNSDPKISSGASPQLPTGSAVYSNGSDKKKSTKDDIVSWRSQ